MQQPPPSLPPSVESSEVVEAYEEFGKAVEAREREEWLIRFLKLHPFVQEKTPVEHEYETHTVTVVGFQLAVYKFRKWLSKEGREYKKAAGGMSDDGLYTLSPMLREVMPRGLHQIRFNNNNNSTENTTMLFKGIPKFSGLVASDEDEQSNATASIFFYHGKKVSDAGGFYVTAKSNGENAKLGCAMVDGVPYLISGSKNTCIVWPAMDPVEKHQKANNPNFPAPFIALLYSDWFLRLTKHEKKRFIHQMTQNFGTIMAEINTPWYEHVVPIHRVYMEWYCLLGLDGKPVHPNTAFEFFHSFGVRATFPSLSQPDPPRKHKTPTTPENIGERVFGASRFNEIKEGKFALDEKTSYIGHVYFQHHDIKELEETVEKIRNAKNTEGAVLYLTDSKSDRVIGLVKVKSSQYVIRRRLRENLKGGLFNPLKGGDIKEFLTGGTVSPQKNGNQKKKKKSMHLIEALAKTKERISSGAKKLTHVPGCAKHWKEWARFGCGFAEWWCESRLLNGLKPESIELDTVLLEARIRIASLFSEFSQALEASEK